MGAERQTSSLDATLHALADPTRRAILRRVARAETRMIDLAAPFPISLNSVSKHVRVLERARLITRRRAGREHLIRFRPEPLRSVQDWISRQQEFWQASTRELEALLNQAQEQDQHQ
jgi:DNA-binding transcriptional ArsR family regulator